MAERDHTGIERYETPAGEPRWRVRWREAGRHRSRSFNSEREAIAYRAERQLARSQGRELPAPRSLITLGQFAATRWWPDYAMLELEPRTRARHRDVWNRWVLPYLGGKPLAAIDTEDLLDWEIAVRKEGIGHETLRRCRAVLSGVYRHACLRPRSTGVRVNPVAALPRLKRKAEAPPSAFSPLIWEVARHWLQGHGGAHGARDATLMCVMAYAGARPGEALSLRVRDVGRQSIAISSARGLDDQGGALEKGTKTGRRRQVPMLAPLHEDLTAWISSQKLGPADLLFPAPDGGLWSESRYGNWRRRNWRPMTEAVGARLSSAGFEQARPYAARHSFASLMIRAGWGNNVRGLADVMGHDLSVLLSSYAAALADHAGSEPLNAETAIRSARRRAAAECGC